MIEGVFYMETSDGVLDDAFMECSVKQDVDLKTEGTSATGNCVIVLSPKDNAFGSFECRGSETACRGRFTLNGGTGEFKGLQGGSEFFIRSPMRQLAEGITDGDDVVVPNGMALFRNLEYNMDGED